MNKNRVWVKDYGEGVWFVVVTFGPDAFLVLQKRTGFGWLPALGGHEYQSRSSALRAAERIGKTLNLPVEVKA